MGDSINQDSKTEISPLKNCIKIDNLFFFFSLSFFLDSTQFNLITSLSRSTKLNVYVLILT